MLETTASNQKTKTSDLMRLPPNKVKKDVYGVEAGAGLKGSTCTSRMVTPFWKNRDDSGYSG